ncbi:hypothetical protein C5167_004861 [Papaver somniferum]|uniref:Cytochrome P450 n=1 Tax=Papaver somniferum TaxID=3469 RepID=A0A4Y7JCN2_PAPSO|nr:hypothetical protein C5167_004861 [Papaver somniferum]
MDYFKISLLILKFTNSHISTSQRLDSIKRQKLDDLFTYICQSASSSSVVDIGHAAFTTIALKEVVFQAAKLNLSDYIPIISFMDVQGIKRNMRSYARIMDGTFDKIIDQKLELAVAREGKSCNSPDLLDIILDPCHENGIELHRQDINSLLKVSTIFSFLCGLAPTIEWALAELLHNPSKISKAQKELSNIIGKNQLLEESDIVWLPYLQAIVKETLRLHPPAPFLLPHKAEMDVKIHDFVVPKGAQVVVNAWAIARDPAIWTEPSSFKPERFLGSKTDYKGQHFELIPFGSGCRICPGLPLAHRMIHLIVGLLLQTFDWKLENEMKPQDMNMEDGNGFALVKATRLRVIPIKL